MGVVVWVAEGGTRDAPRISLTPVLSLCIPQVQELAARAEVYSPRHTSDRVPPSPRSPRAQSASPRGRAPGVRRDQANMATAGLSSDEMVRDRASNQRRNRRPCSLPPPPLAAAAGASSAGTPPR